MNIKKITQLDQVKEIPCALPFCHPGYKEPTPEEVDIVIRLSGLSQRKVAMITGASYSEKGSPRVRNWRASIDSEHHRKIPYGSWRLLLEYLGISSTEMTRIVMNNL